jgi:hypothetical protein
MNDVTELNVMERRIFRADLIPFRELITASNLQIFTAPFSFKEAVLGEDDGNNVVSVRMKVGEFKHNNKIYPVDQLIIDRRSIVFQIQGDSETAVIFYKTIAKLLHQIITDRNFQEDGYLIKTTQTTSVVKLDFDYHDIFSKKYMSFITKDAGRACASAIDEKAKVQIVPRSLAFNVHYTVTDKNLLDHNLRIETKQLVVEPRMGTSLKDRLYYISSPTDSKTHLQLISELEGLFKKGE